MQAGYWNREELICIGGLELISKTHQNRKSQSQQCFFAGVKSKGNSVEVLCIYIYTERVEYSIVTRIGALKGPTGNPSPTTH